MKRYDVDMEPVGYDGYRIDVTEQTDGEWVRYEDHAQALNEARAVIDGFLEEVEEFPGINGRSLMSQAHQWAKAHRGGEATE